MKKFMRSRKFLMGASLAGLATLGVIGSVALDLHAIGEAKEQAAGDVMVPWFEVDPYWPKPLPDRLFAAYTEAGGKGRMVDYGNFQGDSHGMFASRAGLSIWLPEVDAFLRELGLPAGPVQTAAAPDNAASMQSGANKDPQ